MVETSLVLAVLGGLMMGVYPAAIKTRAVVAARPHPAVFQLYKSFWVFITGFFFLLPRYYSQLYSRSGSSEHQHLRAGVVAASTNTNSKHAHDHAQLAPLYVYTVWGLASAAWWIPSGA